jgi:hypothetical protein
MTADFKDGIFPANVKDIFRNNYFFDANNNITQRTGNIDSSFIPAQDSTTYNIKVENSLGSSNQNVDGSVTPVDFSLIFPEPDAGTANYITSISFVMVFSPFDSYADYANRTPLINGIDIFLAHIDETQILQKIRRTSDWLLFFSTTKQIAQQGNTTEGMVSGSIETFPLKVVEGDEFKVTINDNLSGLDVQEIQVAVTRFYL